MRVVIQRCSRAEVAVGDRVLGRIGTGLVVLLGVAAGDTERDAAYLADKTAHLRVFPDEAGKMNLSVLDRGGDDGPEVFVVSQFTLYGDCRRGRRPSYIEAAEPGEADRLYRAYVHELRALGISVHTGEFQAMMRVELVNDGPVTILMDSKKLF